jgi:guanylate kinase
MHDATDSPSRPPDSTVLTRPEMSVATSAERVSGLVFVLSGPSGVGKDSVARQLKSEGFPLAYCVTATTRRQRPGEVHGTHYYFLGVDEFERMRRDDQLIEYAVVHGNYYGVPLMSVREGLRLGKDLLLTVDVQGATTVRMKLPQVISIFLAPPTLDELLPRMASRGTETEEERAIRFANARCEMDQIPDFDYCVINYRDRLSETAQTIRSIVVAERSRVCPRTVSL